MPRGFQACLILMTSFLTLAPASLLAEAASDGWPQFRGQLRDGISRETGLLVTWPEDGPQELWRVPLGEGYSAISVAGDRLYTMYSVTEGEADDAKEIEVAAAFDAATGKELWRTPIGEKVETEFGNGPRATPTVDGDTLYVMGGQGNFAALRAKDGEKLWEMDLQEKFGSRQPYWGYSTSALVEGQTLIVEAGGQEGKCYAALDKKSGEVKWTHGDAPAGYNSPLPVEIHGRKHLVFLTGRTVRGMTIEGEELWSHELETMEAHSMPVFVPPDKLFVSGTGAGSTLLKIAESDGKLMPEVVWEQSTMRNHFSSSIHYNGLIYGFDNATFKVLSAETGELVWAKRRLGKGSLIIADDHLIVLSDKGELFLVEAGSEGWVEKGSVQALEGKTWTAPVLADGRLYLRNHDEMVSYDLRAE